MGIFTTQNEQQDGSMNLLESLIAVVAPHDCIGCGLQGTLLCSRCLSLSSIASPERCGLCGGQSDENKTCSVCTRSSYCHRISIHRPYAGIAKELVKRLKYRNARAAAKVIADQMTVFPSQINEHTLVVPVPTATSRVRQRGYDQSVLIARHLGKRYDLKVSELLVRHGQSRQVGSKRDQRVVQLAEAYTVRNQIHVVGSHIILVDDVMTTGTTIEAAARVLKKAGARTVDACVFARAE